MQLYKEYCFNSKNLWRTHYCFRFPRLRPENERWGWKAFLDNRYNSFSGKWMMNMQRWMEDPSHLISLSPCEGSRRAPPVSPETRRRREGKAPSSGGCEAARQGRASLSRERKRWTATGRVSSSKLKGFFDFCFSIRKQSKKIIGIGPAVIGSEFRPTEPHFCIFFF